MGYKVAVVGATGNVGREMLNILAEREFPADEVFAKADLIVGARSGSLNLLLYSVFRIGNATNNITWASYSEIARQTIKDIGYTDSEIGFDADTGKDLVRVDTRYFRPTEVDDLLGDARSSRRHGRSSNATASRRGTASIFASPWRTIFFDRVGKFTRIVNISGLDVNDLAPGQKHLLYFQGVEMPTGQHWYVSVIVAKGIRPGKRAANGPRAEDGHRGALRGERALVGAGIDAQG